jgi:hypothetical protein
MSWEVHIGKFNKNITFNFSPLFRMMMPLGLTQLHGCTAEEAATIIWHGFRAHTDITFDTGGFPVETTISFVGTGPFVRGTNTIDQGLGVLRELWQVCTEANPSEKVLVFG